MNKVIMSGYLTKENVVTILKSMVNDGELDLTDDEATAIITAIDIIESEGK